jgi:hypothetical protein
MKLDFQASRCDRYKRLLAGTAYSKSVSFEDWDLPVPRIGERVWLKDLNMLEDGIDDTEWRVSDVWWEPEAEDDSPECVVFLELQGVCEDTQEDIENLLKTVGQDSQVR